MRDERQPGTVFCSNQMPAAGMLPPSCFRFDPSSLLCPMTDDKQKAKEQILYLLKMQGATSATDLAEQLEVSPMAIRQHLQALRGEGFVDYSEQRRPIGRPVKLWQLTDRTLNLFPNTHADLMVEFLNSFEAVLGEAELEKVLAERSRRQIQGYRVQFATLEGDNSPNSRQSRLDRQVQRLAEIRTKEGYMAEAIAQPDGSWLFIENHCPIDEAARTCRLLCRSELEVFKTLFGPTITIERVEHIMEGDRRCAYQITPTIKSRGSP